MLCQLYVSHTIDDIVTAQKPSNTYYYYYYYTLLVLVNVQL